MTPTPLDSASHPRNQPLSPTLLSRIFHQPALIYFRLAAETGSIRECARRLNVASSAVSRQIAHLEDALGLALFNRDHRKMSLTQAGEILYRHIRKLTNPLEAAVSELDMLRGLNAGSVRLAASETLALYVLPPLLAEFNTLYPGIHLDVSVDSSTTVVEKLRKEQIDIGFCFFTRPPTGVCSSDRRAVTVGGLMHKNHPLAHERSLSLEDCFAYPLAIGKHGLTIREAIQPLLDSFELSHMPFVEVGSNAMLVEMAHFGRHVSIITSVGTPQYDTREPLVFRELSDNALPEHYFGIVVREREGLRFAPAAFHDFARKFIETETQGLIRHR